MDPVLFYFDKHKLWKDLELCWCLFKRLMVIGDQIKPRHVFFIMMELLGHLEDSRRKKKSKIRAQTHSSNLFRKELSSDPISANNDTHQSYNIIFYPDVDDKERTNCLLQIINRMLSADYFSNFPLLELLDCFVRRRLGEDKDNYCNRLLLETSIKNLGSNRNFSKQLPDGVIFLLDLFERSIQSENVPKKTDIELSNSSPVKIILEKANSVLGDPIIQINEHQLKNKQNGKNGEFNHSLSSLQDLGKEAICKPLIDRDNVNRENGFVRKKPSKLDLFKEEHRKSSVCPSGSFINLSSHVVEESKKLQGFTVMPNSEGADRVLGILSCLQLFLSSICTLPHSIFNKVEQLLFKYSSVPIELRIHYLTAIYFVLDAISSQESYRFSKIGSVKIVINTMIRNEIYRIVNKDKLDALDPKEINKDWIQLLTKDSRLKSGGAASGVPINSGAVQSAGSEMILHGKSTTDIDDEVGVVKSPENENIKIADINAFKIMRGIDLEIKRKIDSENTSNNNGGLEFASEMTKSPQTMDFESFEKLLDDI